MAKFIELTSFENVKILMNTDYIVAIRPDGSSGVNLIIHSKELLPFMESYDEVKKTIRSGVMNLRILHSNNPDQPLWLVGITASIVLALLHTLVY